MAEEDPRRKLEGIPGATERKILDLSVPEFMQIAEQCIQAKDFEKGIALCRQYLDRRPDALGPRLLLGRFYFEMEMTAEAKAEFEKVVQDIEEALSVYKLLSQVYLKEGDVDRALEALRKALVFTSAEGFVSKKMTPLEMDLLRRGTSGSFVTPPIQAEKDLQSEPAPEPISRKTPIQTDTLAEIYIKQGHLEKALSIYQEILARDPGNPLWREKVGALKKMLGAEGKKQERGKVMGSLESWLRVVEKKISTRPA